MACSKGVGFDVGIEGHEFAEKIDSTTSSMKTMPLVIDDSDENNDDDVEIVPSWKTKSNKRKILHTPDSDSE
jgi:hypothetical protein